MTDHRESIPANLPPPSGSYWLRACVVAALAAAAMLLILARGDIGALVTVLGQGSWSLHAPDWTPLAQAGPAIQLHLATVAAAFVIGIVLLTGKKGRRTHRVLGWMWVSLMVATAVDTLFIRQGIGPTLLGFSPLHAFSLWVLITAPLGLYFARRHNVARHRAMMTGLFFGALLVSGAAAYAPGRIMHAVLF